jgi:3-oxoadipate enol-lactonase
MVLERRVLLDDEHRYLESGSGWPLVLLHAFPVNADMWMPQLERAADGWRFIAPDLAGDSMDAMAERVERLLDHLEIERAVIGGLSMGGYVTLAMHRRAPGRFTGLVLADTRAAADSEQAREGRLRLIALARAEGADAVAEAMIPKVLGETARRQQPGLTLQVRDMARANGGDRLADALTAMLNRPDSTATLPRISEATLVMCGDEDTVTRADEMEEMQGRIPRSRFVVLHGAGHLSNLERPDDFSRALTDFLVSNM